MVAKLVLEQVRFGCILPVVASTGLYLKTVVFSKVEAEKLAARVGHQSLCTWGNDRGLKVPRHVSYLFTAECVNGTAMEVDEG